MANAKKYGVIGSPIEHSLSPLIHKAFAKEFNLEISYKKIHAPQDAFAEIVSKFFNDIHGRNCGLTINNFKEDKSFINLCGTFFLVFY